MVFESLVIRKLQNHERRTLLCHHEYQPQQPWKIVESLISLVDKGVVTVIAVLLKPTEPDPYRY